MKLQDAYAAESGTVGNWVSIGYIAPGAKSAKDATGTTSAFTYSGGNATVTVSCPQGAEENGEKCVVTSDDKKTEVSATGGSTDGWSAKSNVKLNDCVLGSVWAIKSETTTGVVTYTKTIDGTAITNASVASCSALTPSFGSIGN